jgi:hypothetical protein
MPSVQEILKESGFSDSEIASMDNRAITAFSGVLSTAERERQANVDFYENQIAPSLANWDEEKVRMDNERARIAAEVAYYKAQNEAARASGFIPSDAPGYQPPRDGQGRYVANGGGTPGSPTFEPAEIVKRASDGLAMISDVDWRHRQLFDKPLPISPSELIRQADARHISPMVYAEQVFNFKQREQELQQKQQEAHDNAIRKEATEQRDKFWAERRGSNPDVHQPMENPRMTEVARAVKSGTRSDPLQMNENERRQQTRQMIHAELAEQT